MKSIIVPVNFSTNSINAARYAADTALAIDAEVHLLYIIHLPLVVSEYPTPDFVYEEMRESGVAQLKALQEELSLRTENKVSIRTHMEAGPLEYRIESYCQQHKPFLVVMGASARSMENIFVGSSVSKAMSRLQYPILVVPENAVFHPIKKIVLACDLEDVAAGMPVSLPFLKNLKDLFGAQFEVVNIATAAEERTGQAVFEYDSWKSNLHDLFPELHFVQSDNIREGVGEYIGKHEGDWLMVFPKKHGVLEFHKSEAKKIVRECPVPVISVHE